MAWICDSCGLPIEDPRHGYVEWLSDPNIVKRTAYGLRLVHHIPFSPKQTIGGCQYDSDFVYKQSGVLVSDRSLERFLQPDGLPYLRSLIYDQIFADDQQVLDMIQRLYNQ